MRRGPKPAKSEGESKPPNARKSPKNGDASGHDQEKRLAEALRDKAEAQEQQAATAEILRVISRSQTDLQPVFDTIAQSAVRLCGGVQGNVVRFDGELVHRVAGFNLDPEGEEAFRDYFPRALGRELAITRSIQDGSVVHVPDTLQDTDPIHELAQATRARALLAVPMLRDGQPIGAISVARREARPFSDSQIALLQTFADQAVIAIENVRLFNETKEALDQQTATAEILGVISRTPTDVQPVFEAIVESAVRLCDGLFGGLVRFDGDLIYPVATHNYTPEALDALHRVFPTRPSRTLGVGRAILDRDVVHIPDVELDPEYRVQRLAGTIGFRSGLFVPMLLHGTPIGAILVARAEPGPFPDRQIALLRTFADQAVIAIENVRLFKELESRNRDLTEALEQQTATSAVLRVISRSPTDVAPVFDVIVEHACRLSEGVFANVVRFDGELMHNMAQHGFTSQGRDAVLRFFPARPTRASMSGRAILSGTVVYTEDARRDDELSVSRELSELMDFRAQVSVPMLRDGTTVGAITVARRAPGRFPERQVALLQTFADQAVIAIENVRLFTELQEKNHALTQAHAQVSESLQQQTATSEVLKVISRAAFDLQPVLQTLVDNATRLCGAESGVIWRFDGEVFRLAAERGVSPELKDSWARYPFGLGRGSATGRTALEGRTVHIPDVLADPEYTLADAQRAGGFRTILGVPMLKDGVIVGVFGLQRYEVQPFTDRQIELVTTFADQAVIAIENVRLFTELQTSNRDLTTALEQQTATSEILRVISSSPTDVQPVVDTIAAKALDLCQGQTSAVFTFDGEHIHVVASHSFSPQAIQALRQTYPMPLSRGGAAARAVMNRAIVYIPDIREDPEYRLQGLATAVDYLSIAAVPMLHEGKPIGAVGVTGRGIGGFSERQIELLKTFADQAVIAIENVRLFTELQEKNKALTEAHAQVTESLEQQTATSEILRVISQSPTDVQPVFDAIVDSAVRLCDGAWADAYRFDGERQHLVACSNLPPEGRALLQSLYPRAPDPEAATGRAILDRAVIHVPDVHHDPRFAITRHVSGTVGGASRSVLAVPMLHQGKAVGVILVHRGEQPRPFSSAEIDLLKTFADQAVIAIENVRLFKELEARTQDLTRSVGELRALGEVGQAISSTLDLQTVLSTIAARATQLSGTDAGVIYEYDEQREIFVPRATEHLEAAIVETMLATPVRKGEGATGRLAEVPEPVQVPDILVAPAESRVRGSLVRAGYRALLAVPLVREDSLIGALTVIRKATGDFSPDIVELLKTFATQSALAIQNARLFREIEQKSHELEAASHHKSEFLANMSHELRTPLNAVIGFSEVLSERMFGDLNEKQDEYLKDIHASGQHLLSLINDILDLSKIEAGRMELEVTEFDLPMAIDNALTLIRERAARRSITLHTTVDERLGQVQGDERKIRQVLLNLLSNAIKFTPEGGRIDVGAKPVNGSIEVSVTDTGVGIAPEDQEAVFEEFRQVGTAEKKVEGTGLGLALSRKFIELHGGKIWVKSQVGAGSTFTFTVPVRRGE